MIPDQGNLLFFVGCGLAAITALSMFYYSEERHWIQRDLLLESSPDAVTGHERKVTAQLRKELLSKLAALEEAL